jgi:large subunit ribosomal protein L25
MSTEQIALDATMRTVIGKKVKRLRKEGWLPATVYGKQITPLSIQVDGKTFNKTYQKAGGTSLVRLNIPGQPVQSAFIQSVQRHPVKRDIIHADFHVVDLTIRMHAEIPIVLTGSSPLVERDDATVNQVLSSVEIEALPEDVPHQIDIDISVLDSFDAQVFVRDLAHGSDYRFVTPEDTLILSLTMVRAHVSDEAAEEEPVSAAEPELIRKERSDEE